MGLTGLEPVTLRLSSACSNQLSYRPGIAEFSNFDCRFSILEQLARFARIYLNRQSQIANRKSNGGKGIRTPDFQLAKLALYQLSYAPAGIAEFRLLIFDCKEEKKNAGCRCDPSSIRQFVRL
jgi:hypothetical protein